MGRGRKRTATAVLEANGAFKKNPQRRRTSEPKVVQGEPKIPASLKGNKIACAKWKHVCGLLSEMKVLSTADHDLLEQYCLNYSELAEQRKLLETEGHVIEGTRGTPIRNPRSVTVMKLVDQQLKMLVEFGLTPQARTKLHAAPTEEEDALTEFMKRRDSLN